MQPPRFYQQLKATGGGDVVTLDPTGTNRAASFSLSNIETRQGRNWLYADRIRFWVRTQLDQPSSGGAIVRADQIFRMIQSVQLKSDDLGTLYGPSDLTGPQLGLIAQVISNRYSFPSFLRSDIAAADGDTAIIFPVDLPLAHHCFFKGHQTAIWNGFLKGGGQVDFTINDSTALAAVSTGAALEATTDVRAELIYTSEPEARPPTVWHWRTHETPAGEFRHVVKGIAQGTGIKGASGAGKVAMLAYLSNRAGLGGAGGIDNIQRVWLKDRGGLPHDLGAPFYGAASFLTDFIGETRRENVFAASQGSIYPLELGTNVEGVPNVATALFLPLFWPDPRGQEVSKLQEWSGDYGVELTYASTPAVVGKWIALEQSYQTADYEAYLMRDRMQLPPEQFTAYAKVRGMNNPGDQAGALQQQAKLRGIPRKIRARAG